MLVLVILGEFSPFSLGGFLGSTLQMFTGIYRDSAGKLECGDFKFMGIACIPAIPVFFEVNQKKCGLFIYTLY